MFHVSKDCRVLGTMSTGVKSAGDGEFKRGTSGIRNVLRWMVWTETRGLSISTMEVSLFASGQREW